MDREYIEYAGVLILSVLGAASAYFIDLSRPETLISLVLVPVLYSFTVYISRGEFNYAVLAALPALLFTLIGGITAAAAVFYSVGPVLVSYFTSGGKIRDFYSSTSLPMLIVGLTLGTAVFTYGNINPEFQDDLKQDASEKIGEMASILAPSQILEQRRRAQLRLINQTAAAAFNLTAQKLKPGPGQELEEVRNSVRTSIYNKAVERMEKDINVSERVEKLAENQIQNLSFVFAIPIIAGFIYSLQPLVGLLTALFGTFIRAGERLFHRLKDHVK